MEQITDLLKQLKKLPFIDDIYLFGSRTDSVHAKYADIDIAINCPNATIKEWQQILDIIENAETLLKIDCIRYDKISDKLLKQEIDNKKVILYARNNNTN